MLGEHKGFIEKICADPHDVGIRLIFADWLEENGEEARAEFIRVQCKLAELHCTCGADGTFVESGTYGYGPRTKEPCDFCCRYALRRRERELQANKRICEWFSIPGLAVSWTANEGLCGWFHKAAYEPAGSTLRTTLRRGFVEVVSCTCDNWLTHGPAVVRCQPILEVRLSDPVAFTNAIYYMLQKQRRLMPSPLPDSLTWAHGPHPERGLAVLENKP